MRVALLSHTASPRAPTGAERSLSLLAAGLAARGHEVAVVAPGPWSLAGELLDAGVELVTIPTRACWLVQWQPQPAVWQAFRWLRYTVPDAGRGRLRAWLEGFAPDVVHVNCLPHLAGAVAASSLQLPVVWHVREMLPPSRRRRWWVRHLRRHATAIVAVSGAVAGWLGDEGLGDRVTVVHNGVDPPADLPDRATARDRFGIGGDDVVVGFVGQLVAHKGALELIEAVHRLRAGGRPVSAVLAGTGPDSFRRRAMVAAGKSGAVRLLGAVETPWELLAACDVVAVPTLWPDPLPRSVLEAMAVGRPVVAFAAGGIPEMVVDGTTGLLAVAGNADGFRAALDRLIGKPELRRRFGSAARDRAGELFSLDRHVATMEAVLSAVARHGDRGGTSVASSASRG